MSEHLCRGSDAGPLREQLQAGVGQYPFLELLEQRLLLDAWYVNAAAAGGGDGSARRPFQTIQTAIDAAAAGDTVNVANGTYTQDLTVNVANLTIQSAHGSATTIIQLVDEVGITLEAGATNFALGGSQGHGFRILSGAGTTRLVELVNGPSGVEISYNLLNTTGNATMGISVGAAGATGLGIAHNTFTAGDLGDGSIWGPDVVGVVVDTNTFTGPAALAASGYAVQFSGVTGASTIHANTISNYGNGILISNGTGTSGLTISSNVVSASTNGIRFAQYSPGANGDMTTVSITGNQLLGNTTGLRIGDGANVKASDFTITGNAFDGNTTGLWNQHATEAVDAAGNWWGSIGGPAIAGNVFTAPGGPGDPIVEVVEDSVSYVPWLDAADGDPYYPVHNVTQDTFHVSIQAAIDAAAAHDVIEAADGTFTEDLVIDVEGLTLVSANGAFDTTTIQLVDGVGIDINAGNGANGFTLGGEDAGFTILSGAGTTFMIQLANNPTHTTIAHNRIDVTGNASHGISIGIAGATGLTIDSNTFLSGDESEFCIYGPFIVDLMVTDNTFTADSLIGTNAMQFPGVTADVLDASVISGNMIDGFGRGIGIFHGRGVSDLVITDNTVSSGTTGIDIGEYNPAVGGDGGITTLSITDNTLTDHTTGLRVRNSAFVLASDFTITGNAFDGNTTGLWNQHATEAVDAAGNWWGSIGGPAIAGNVFTGPDGPGDPIVEVVEDSVSYVPWLDAADGDPYYPVHNVTQDTFHVSIQAAIDAAAAHDVIEAADGTFTEDLVIDVEGLTLVSANGAFDTTTIQLVDGVGIDIQANGVTLGGQGAGFDIQTNGNDSTFAVQVASGATGVSILYNVINTDEAPSQGVSMNQTAGLTVEGNVFQFDQGDAAVTWNPESNDAVSSNTIIEGNTFTVTDGDASNAVKTSSFQGMTIEGNTFGSNVVVFVGGGGADSDGLTIEGNTFHNASEDYNGIAVLFVREDDNATGTLGNVAIAQNDFAGCYRGVYFYGGADGTGIEPGNMDWATLGIHENRFQDVPKAVRLYGAKLDDTVLIDVTDNYWGTDSGPIVDGAVYTHPGGPADSSAIVWDAGGDLSTAVVDYTPWWTGLAGQAGGFTGTPFAPVFIGEAGYAGLQAAIDAAAAGQTLEVAPGTFEENVSVAKGLTIEGAGPGQTILQGADHGVVLDIAYAGTEPQPLLIDGFTVRPMQDGTAAGDWPVQVGAGSSYVTLSGSTVDATDPASQAISLAGGGAYDHLTFMDNTILFGNTGINFNVEDDLQAAKTSITIDGNTFTPTSDDWVGIKLRSATGVAITDNTWTTPPVDADPNTGMTAVLLQSIGNLTVTGNELLGSGTGEFSYGLDMEDVNGTSVVASNSFRYFRYGIVVTQGPDGAGSSGLIIGGPAVANANLFSYNSGGILIYDSGDGAVANVTVRHNRFSLNDIGIRVGHPCASPSADLVASTITIRDNHFDMTNAVGLWNHETTAGGAGDDTITPAGDWWGDRTGPTYPANPGGHGVLVRGLMDFSARNYSRAALDPRADLAATIRSGSVKLKDTLVPGAAGTVPVVVTNLGDGRATGQVTIAVYLRPVGGGADVAIGQNTVGLILTRGASWTYNVRVEVPNAAANGDYVLYAEVDTTNAIAELLETNNAATGNTTYTVARQFGNVPGNRGYTDLVLTDPVTGDEATFILRGPGIAAVTVGLTGFDIALEGTSARTKVLVRTARGDEATLNDVTSALGLYSFTAATADLVGTFTAAGPVQVLTLGNVIDGDLSVAGDLGRLTAIQWAAGAIDIDGALTMLNIAGDFLADLNIDNLGNLTWGLRWATIRGDVGDADPADVDVLVAQGNVGTFRVYGDANNFDLTVTDGDARTLAFGVMTRSDIRVAGGAVGSLTAEEWTGDLGVAVDVLNVDTLNVLNADTLDVLNVDTLNMLNITGRGDGNGNLDHVAVTAANADAARYGVRTVKIAGNMRNGASITSTGDMDTVSVLRDMDMSAIAAASRVRSVTVGKMIDSTIFAGVADPPDVLPLGGDGVSDLPAFFGDGNGEIEDGHEIGRVDVLGYRGAVGDLFVNSNIAASGIGTINLRDARLDNDGTPFGVAGETITKVTLRQGNARYTWRQGAWTPVLADAGDLLIRLAEV